MKILHFDFDDLENPLGGGQAVRTFEINRRLVKMGHEVTVVTVNYPGAKSKIKEGIKYQRIGIEKFPWGHLSYFMNIEEVIKSHKFDLIVEDNMPPCFGMSPRYTKKAVISQVQSFFSKQYFKPMVLLEKVGAKLYKNFIVLTKNMEQEIKNLNPKATIKIIPNGLNTVPSYKFQEKDYLLFLGRIDFFQKGLDYLLKCAKILKKKAPDIKIVIAGHGTDVEKLQKTIQNEKLTNVKYIGKVTGQEKEKIISECKFLLLPSRFEIFPFTILEAAAHGKPTVCFQIENLAEIIEEKIGLMCKPFSIKAYSNLILTLFQNDQERIKLGKNAYAWATRHKWDAIVKKQEAFYLSCVNNNNQ